MTDQALRQKVNKTKWISDDAPRGHGRLSARIEPTPKPTLFYFKYSNSQRKEKRLPVGKYDRQGLNGFTLSGAREKAAELSSMHRSGITDLHEHFEALAKAENIRQELESRELQNKLDAEKARLSFADAYEQWHSVVSLQRKDGEEIKRIFNKDILPMIGNTVLTELKKGHITHVTDSILRRGSPSIAKRALSLIRQMISYCIDRDYLELDPSSPIKKRNIGGKTKERTRVLNSKELKEFAYRLRSSDLKEQSKLALWIMLGTCTRIGEVIKARWVDIDLENAKWVFPEEHETLHSKTGEPHYIPLSPFVIAHLTKLKKLTASSKWLFPNSADTNHLDVKTITKQVRDRQIGENNNHLKKRTKNTDALILPGGRWVPHDLRRTGATMMVEMGVLPEVAERCLSHTEANKMRKVYQQHQYTAEKHQAWMKLGERLDELTNIE